MPHSNIPTVEEYEQQLQETATSFEWQQTLKEAREDSKSEYADKSPSLDWAYEPLENLVRLVTGGIENSVMLDAPGGLGKTHNIKQHLGEHLEDDEWAYQAGYTSPMELYKTLYKNRDKVIFLDDMSGITKNDKCLEILKAATDTEGDANRVSWNTSRAITDDRGLEVPNMFYFRGSVIMSFNETPDDDRNFDALSSRGQYYSFNLDYEERTDVLREVIKNPDFHRVQDYDLREEMVDWVETVTDPSTQVNIRTLEKILNIRLGAENELYDDWERTALEVFDFDYEMYLIKKLHDSDEYESVGEQQKEFCEKTNRSKRHYYDKKAELEQQTGPLQ